MIAGLLRSYPNECFLNISLALLLVLLLLFLVLLLTSTGLFFLVISEFFNQESSHDSLTDLGAGEDATICSGHGSLGGSHSPEVIWSGNLHTLHLGSFGVFLNKMQNKLSTWRFDWFEIVAPRSVSASSSVLYSPF